MWKRRLVASLPRKSKWLILFTAFTVYFFISGDISLRSQIDVPTYPETKSTVVNVPILSNSGGVKSIYGKPVEADARPIYIRKYLGLWKSPLVPFANLIVEESDKHGVDPHLVVAIAQKESGLGRAGYKDCFNAWGWAQTKKYTRCFDSWEDGIKKFISEFSQNYIKKGLLTPEEIMAKYNPISPNGAWAVGVARYLNDLEEFSS